ncbi:putative reverse transcriptase domain-containing protein, partial [Tanacetum coccineum]
VMSSSMVTYTSISSDSDLPPWGFHLMDPDEFEAPQSPEHAPPSREYVPGPKYPDYVAPSDDEIPVKDQSLPVNASPTALSSGYVADSDPLEEDREEDPEEDLADYPADGGDDKEEESSEDDNDDEYEEEDEDEEEEHLASTDSAALPAIDPVPSARETEPFETDESATTPPPPKSPQTMVPFSQTGLRSARKTVRPQPPMIASTEALIAKYASTPTPPSPPLSPLPPLLSLLPRIPFPPLHISPTYASAPLGYRAAMVQLRAASPSTYHPLPVPSPPLLLPFVDRRSDIPNVDMPSQKRLCLTATASRVDYGFIDTLDASIQASEDRVMTAVEEDRSTALDALIRAQEARTTALEAQTRALQRDVSVLQRQRIDDSNRLTTSHIQYEHDSLLGFIGVADALAEHEANRNSRNGDDSYESGSGGRRTVPTTHECTYSDFLKCQPLNFKGTEEVVGLTQWFEKMEYVFHISNCAVACQIKFVTCTLLSSALTRWNSHVKTVGHDVAYGMPWKTLMKMMTAKYCPRSEIKKLEIEIWNLNVKGTNVMSYTQRFQELALMCGTMFLKEFDEVEKYVGGLPDIVV